jgi:glycosyltransferase 2 family protein
MKSVDKIQKKHLRLGQWAGFIISIFLLWLTLRRFDVKGVWQILVSVRYIFCIPITAIVIIDFGLRALRWGQLFDTPQKPGLKNLFNAMMIGYLANNILPARAGELVRSWVLGKQENRAKTSVLATIVVERVCDLLMALLLLAVVLFYYPLPSWCRAGAPVVAAAGLAAGVFIILLNVMGERFVAAMSRLFAFLPASLNRRITVMGDCFITGVSALKGPMRMSLFIVYTLVIWLMEIAITFLVLKMFALPVSLGASMFVMLLVGLGSMIPSSPGYVGTYEFFGTNALAVLGITGSVALGATLVLHLVTFAGASVIGAVCLAFYKDKKSLFA